MVPECVPVWLAAAALEEYISRLSVRVPDLCTLQILYVTETPAGISAPPLRYRHIPLRVRQSARLDARPAATGALESARLDACFLHQRVWVPLDAAVTPVTLY